MSMMADDDDDDGDDTSENGFSYHHPDAEVGEPVIKQGSNLVHRTIHDTAIHRSRSAYHNNNNNNWSGPIAFQT